MAFLSLPVSTYSPSNNKLRPETKTQIRTISRYALMKARMQFILKLNNLTAFPRIICELGGVIFNRGKLIDTFGEERKKTCPEA